MIITIDGPSGTGKSTVAKGIAKRLHYTFFDTGAMYRAFAWLVLKEGFDPENQEQTEKILPKFDFEIRNNKNQVRSYFVQGTEVTSEIRTQNISAAASQVAVYPEVRKAMVKIQRKFGHSVDAVFEGRDMGTVVFPNANLKVFLTARAEVRAERRYQELMHKFPDVSISQEGILKEIEERDDTDMNRTVSPLKQADDAILIDTSALSAQQVIEKIVALHKPKRTFPKKRFTYSFVYWAARIFFKCFFRLKIYGIEHFRSGPAIIAANHASFYDPPVLSISCPEEVHFLAKQSLFKIPLLGRMIRTLNSHPVKKGASDIAVFRQMVELLSVGNKLILFPEGERSFDGQLLPLQRGLAFIVQKAECRVIPAYISGSFKAWPRGRKLPKLFGKMTVVFGSPIEYKDLEDRKKTQARITEKTERAIRRLKEWLERGAKGVPP